MFGETVFTLIRKEKESQIIKILEKYADGMIIKTEVDKTGARVS